MMMIAPSRSPTRGVGVAMNKPIEIGDRVATECPFGRPAGTYYGIVRTILPNYNWTDDTWAYVTGDEPAPFEVTTRVSALTLVGEEDS